MQVVATFMWALSYVALRLIVHKLWLDNKGDVYGQRRQISSSKERLAGVRRLSLSSRL
jgi:hypothetical protein